MSPRPSARREPELVAARAAPAQIVVRALHEPRRQLQHVADRPADRRPERHAGDRLGGAIERQDPLRRIGRGQPARQAVDDVLIERLQVGDLRRRLLEPGAGRPQAVGERAAQQRDGEEAEHVQRDRTARPRPAAARPTAFSPATGRSSSPTRRRVLREHQADVEHRAERRHEQAAAPELHGARRDDRQHVERREVARDAAGEIDERRHDQRVAGQLQVDQPPVPLDEAQRQRVADRQRVGQADQEEERDRRRTTGGASPA